VGESAFVPKAAKAIVSEVTANAFASITSLHALSLALSIWTIASIVVTTTVETF